MPDDPYSGPPEEDYSDELAYDPEGMDIDIRKEIMATMSVLRNQRKHLFNAQGLPKKGVDFRDIKSYMASTTQVLTMLQKFEEALKTDADLRKIETAISMALEDSPCPEFAEHLKRYLSDEPAEALQD
ncbi:MAG: hypothetical protein PVI43_00025 [Candidatus Bathyarchaeota archaeon]